MTTAVLELHSPEVEDRNDAEYLPPPQLLQMSATETLLGMLAIREEQVVLGRKVSPKPADKVSTLPPFLQVL